MKKTHGTKRSLLMSALALVLCFSMLIGSTFAWFTDSVTSAGNIIKSGTLDVEMYWADGAKAPADATWADASQGAIFNYDLWEPGYVQARHIRVTNAGNLALKYQMRILANGVVTELADVIDVYYYPQAEQLDRTSLKAENKLGTLSEVLNNTFENAVSKKIVGTLEPGKSQDATIALKMQESAGNEYQNLTIGTDFSVQIIATQLESEFDSFDNTYDAGADFAPQEVPAAMVSLLIGKELNIPVQGFDKPITLDAGYQFEPTETAEQGAASKWANAHADFYVYADDDVPANSLMLAGYYKAFCDLLADGNWVGLTAPDTIKANQGVRLIADGMNGGDTLGGITVPYSAICELGNDGVGFRCGVADLTGENAGTTISVELRLYEVLSEEECLEQFGFKSANKETGNYITIGKIDYLLGGEYETLEDGTVLFNYANGDVVLYDTQDVDAVDYAVPEGVTQIGDYAFTHTDTIETVTLPSSVKDLGRGFDSNTTVKKVVLNEGLTTISSRAFRATTALEEVVIPSTVTEIADNAFQKSGIKHITIPATVKTIGETAFGASLIESVTFEGNTEIQGYAFRGCTALRTVTMKGDDVKFVKSTLNGRESMWFCNGESNNPGVNNITFHVENDVVASRVADAMGAGTNFYIFVGDQEVFVKKVANITQLQSALDSAVDGTIINFTADITGDVTVNQPGDQEIDLVINGNGKKYDGTMSIKGNSNANGSDSLLIKNINFETSTASEEFVWSADSTNGSVWRYAHNVTIENCTFTATGEAVYTAIGAKFQQAYNIKMVGCTGTGLHTLLQAESCGSTVTVDGCKVVNGKNAVSFNNTMNAVIKNTEIEANGDGSYGIRHKGQVNGYALTVENCTVKAFVPVLIRNMTGSGYTATFTGTNTLTATNTEGYQIAIANGDWDGTQALVAPTGSYTVTGADAFNCNAAYTK